TSVGFAVVGAVVGEYLGSAAGLGYLIQQAEGVFGVAGVFAGMLVLAAFVIGIDLFVTLAEPRLLVWRPVAGRNPPVPAAVSGRLPAAVPPPYKTPTKQDADQDGSHLREDEMRTTKIALAMFALALSAPAHGQAVEKKELTLAVGGKTALYYLPLTICERLGYFKEQGLDVTINDFRGGAQSLQALVGGSVDVVTGAYEHTIRMQAKGQDIKAVIELGRFPGIVVGV